MAHKLDEVTHWASVRCMLDGIDTTMRQADGRLKNMEHTMKDISRRQVSTEIMTSAFRRELDEHAQHMTDSIQGMNCKLDLLHYKLNTRVRELRSEITDVRESSFCKHFLRGCCTRVWHHNYLLCDAAHGDATRN